MKRLYFLTCDGQKITDRPLTITEIVEKYGSVQELEAAGYLLIAE